MFKIKTDFMLNSHLCLVCWSEVVMKLARLLATLNFLKGTFL